MAYDALARAMTSPTHASRRRIVVADDNVYVVKALEILLGLWGLEVTAVYDGSAAVEAVRAERPSAVLLDLHLPKLDGLEVARQLRGDHADLLLVALTGSDSPWERKACLAAGFNHHLVKPVDPTVLRKLIDPASAATPPR